MRAIDAKSQHGDVESTSRMTQRVRVAVVNSHPIQYFAPLYAYFNRDPALEVTALYCSDFSLRDGIDPGFKRTVTWDVDLLQGYPHVFVGSTNDRGSSPWFLVANVPRIWSEIRSGRSDVVWLHGYNYAASALAFAAAKSKALTRTDAHRNAPRSNSSDLASTRARHGAAGVLSVRRRVPGDRFCESDVLPHLRCPGEGGFSTCRMPWTTPGSSPSRRRRDSA